MCEYSFDIARRTRTNAGMLTEVQLNVLINTLYKIIKDNVKIYWEHSFQKSLFFISLQYDDIQFSDLSHQLIKSGLPYTSLIEIITVNPTNQLNLQMVYSNVCPKVPKHTY